MTRGYDNEVMIIFEGRGDSVHVSFSNESIN